MCVKTGGFTVYEGGEIDARGCYCVMAVCKMLRLETDELVKNSNMVQFLKSCQTYEGGLAGEPGAEAHGGYAFCGLGALALTGNAHVLDLTLLMEWASRCMGEIEGGFRGRTNKLVDGCYSYWMGALFPLLKQLGVDKPGNMQKIQDLKLRQELGEIFSANDLPLQPIQILQTQQKQVNTKINEFEKETQNSISQSQNSYYELLQQDDFRQKVQLMEKLNRQEGLIREDTKACENSVFRIISELNQPFDSVYDSRGLQLWLLLCSQIETGGFVDKPGKMVDWYHTCYCLSGLAIAQQWSGEALPCDDNLLEETDLICNIVVAKYNAALEFFKNQNSI
eukprot:TRINITY_DN14086_c0_g1_i3.p2 TRINITY_DN14086_c0_g1~~TRINITY_DN14086_c0_g1_i3.p2  ORF type:complete len:337 (+),score=43.26 TRINITY_DN14086_c0_g1_i3:226-1236(+)